MKLTLTLLGEPSLLPGIDRALEVLTAQDVSWLRAHPGTPRLYEAGVVYRLEPFGEEQWLTIPEVQRLGWGDCEDLAAWRAAELRLNGHPHARAFGVEAQMLQTPIGRVKVIHILVSRSGDVCDPDSVEDPSVRLGMPPAPHDVLVRSIMRACGVRDV